MEIKEWKEDYEHLESNEMIVGIKMGLSSSSNLVNLKFIILDMN